ncbi:MAG: Lrp/AsnC family transcriptional regulator [Actinomycetota bacterium]|jgi:Lrp/AsnC family transcriptional regulator|nr:Lrp/AsnC family transcriptional regulator [Actinomycetota bacterium]MEC9394882.1 Lrp/AsnC family transcriptional regulator [Actinomycetota bacterium]MEC9467460.1 Lrp/AsnC family transcriptional regulator [Actinomycetota bacterium]MED6328186.1 Lrp/AsnC family transcriptional regulator [Actinomycetota bacterium]MEE2958571.1 Lrp/AsnC family transcriptional regulator [Actinomycetota bacterium]
MDDVDRHLVQILQEDASLSTSELGEKVGLSATSCWRRIQRLRERGVLTRRVELVDRTKVNLGLMALVEIRASDHSAAWLDQFVAGITDFPEIVDAWRTSGQVDYMLRVVVPDIAAYDDFYKRMTRAVDFAGFRSIFVMEDLKSTTALPLDYVDGAAQARLSA